MSYVGFGINTISWVRERRNGGVQFLLVHRLRWLLGVVSRLQTKGLWIAGAVHLQHGSMYNNNDWDQRWTRRASVVGGRVKRVGVSWNGVNEHARCAAVLIRFNNGETYLRARAQRSHTPNRTRQFIMFATALAAQKAILFFFPRWPDRPQPPPAPFPPPCPPVRWTAPAHTHVLLTVVAAAARTSPPSAHGFSWLKERSGEQRDRVCALRETKTVLYPERFITGAIVRVRLRGMYTTNFSAFFPLCICVRVCIHNIEPSPEQACRI